MGIKHAFSHVAVLHREDGAMLGVDAGWDFTSEHERGVAPLKRALGAVPGAFDLSRFKMSQPADGLFSLEKGVDRPRSADRTPWARLVLAATPFEFEIYARMQRDGNHHGQPLVSRWNENGLILTAYQDAAVAALEFVHDGLLTQDIFIAGTAIHGSFQKSNGLSLTRASRWDAADIENVLTALEDERLLLEAAENTGVAARLKQAKLGWYALSPRWVKQGEKSNHLVTFFLNPHEQHLFNAGWFTVEELDLWAQGKGPIPKAA